MGLEYTQPDGATQLRRCHATMMAELQSSQPSWGTLQAWWEPVRHYWSPPVSSATWHLQVEGSQGSACPPERIPQEETFGTLTPK